MKLAEAFIDIRPEFSAFRGGMLRGITSELSFGTKALGAFGLAAGAAMVAGVMGAAQFEQRLSGIQAVSGITGATLEAVRAKALQLGADTVFSATEAAGAMETLVKAGVSVEQVLNGAADAAVALAAAGDVSLDVAATIASNALNQFGLGADRIVRVADLVAGAANASAIGVEDFGLSLAQAGAVANLAGLSFEDTATAIALLGNAGVRGSDAGTSLKTMFNNLIPVTEREKNLFRELGLTLEDGTNQFFTAQGAVKGLAEIAGTLEEALRGQTDQQKLSNLALLFGSDAIRAAGILTNEGAAGVRALNDEMNKTTAAEVAATRLDNLAGSAEQFRGSLEGLVIMLGTPLQSGLRGVLDFGTDTVNMLTGLADSGGPVVDTFTSVVDLSREVARFLGDVAGSALRAGEALVTVGGGVVLTSLQGYLEILGPLARFLGENELAADLLATVLTARLIVAVARLIGGSALGGLVTTLGLTAGRLGATALAMVAMHGPVVALEVAAVGLFHTLTRLGPALALGGAVYGLQQVTTALDKADDAGAKLFERLTAKGLASNSLEEVRRAAAGAGEEATKLSEKVNEGRFTTKFARDIAGWGQAILPVRTSIFELREETNSAIDAEEELARRLVKIGENAAAIAHATGLPAEGIARLADAMSLDLAGPFTATTGKVIASAQSMFAEIQGAGAAAAASAGALQVMEAAAEELASSMAESFGAASDITGAFQSTVAVGADLTAQLRDQASAARDMASGANAVQDAHRGLRDSSRAVADAQRQVNDAVAKAQESGNMAELGRANERVAREQDQLASAQERAAEAQRKLGDAQGKLAEATSRTGSGVLGILRGQLNEATTFQADIARLLEAGVDPTLVRELAQAGPDAARETVAGVLAEVRAGHTQAVNETVQSLRDAQNAVKGQSAAFFVEQMAEAGRFRDHLKELIAAGLDPALVRELAMAGPEAAAGAAGALVAEVRAGNVGTINQARTDLRTILAETTAMVESYTAPIRTAAKNLVSEASLGLGEGLAAIPAAVQRDTANVLSTLFVDTAAGVRVRAFNEGKAAGEAYKAGAAEGVKQGTGVNQAAVEVINRAVTAAKEHGRIRSPSGLFADEVGAPIAAGIAAGIAANTGLVADQLANIVTIRPPMGSPTFDNVAPGYGGPPPAPGPTSTTQVYAPVTINSNQDSAALAEALDRKLGQEAERS